MPYNGVTELKTLDLSKSEGVLSGSNLPGRGLHGAGNAWFDLIFSYTST